MAVMVKVNGEGPYRLIFDTGAPITLFNNSWPRKPDCSRTAEAAIQPFGTIGEVEVKELQVGEQTSKDQPAIVMDHPTVSVRSAGEKLGGPLDGIVGFPFFARYKMTLDYQAKTLTLVPTAISRPT